MARYFEFGAFSGFYLNVMGSMIKERYAWNVLPYNIYTEKDVIVEKQRACGLYASRRIEKPKKEYKNFSRKIYKRTSTGIAQCMSNLLQEKVNEKWIVIWLCVWCYKKDKIGKINWILVGIVNKGILFQLIASQTGNRS
ncbi:uncharacterized protein LOC130649446 [Hydractinia symbiolongicarpus]|uniref:uncharacterized protein LOC130649446 n=1 Tax=Hydractinia symbiolongicarpus TaxID=13093 RepID=UPI00254C2134|nr:uncharacterized protein LOC130649446 [Hydractinia symbiolongicarpus]